MGSIISKCFPFIHFPFSLTLFSTKRGRNYYSVRQGNELPFSISYKRPNENETISLISTSPLLPSTLQNQRRLESVELNLGREKESSPHEVFSELTDVCVLNEVRSTSNAREPYEIFSYETVKQSFLNYNLRKLLSLFSPAQRRHQMLKDSFEHFDCEKTMFKPNRFPHISKCSEALSPIIEETPDVIEK